MDFGLTTEQKMLKKSVTDFMKKECTVEFLRQQDEEEAYPYKLYKKMAKLGWFGLAYPEEYGGSGLSATDFILIAEEMARFSFEITAGFGITVFCGLIVLKHGTQEQKDYYIPDVISGKQRLSIAISEPEAGSDAAALSTTAVSDGDHWVINGQKTFQTAADIDNTTMCVFVRTDEDLPKHKGISLILVPNDIPGITITRIKTLARKMIHTCEVFFDNVRVPKTNLVGKLNNGMKILISGLELERLFACSSYNGSAQAAMDLALDYAKRRQQFGKPIASFQAIAHMLADMQTEIDAARLLTQRAIWMYDQGTPCMKEVSMAKLFGSETYVKIANQGMQIMGGYGYTMEYEMQRHFRDSRVLTVSAGSSQMQRTGIAKALGVKV